MVLALNIILVASAAALLLSAPARLPRVRVGASRLPFVNHQITYQGFALGIALFVTSATVLLYHGSVTLLSVGELADPASAIGWLGVDGRSSWLSTAVGAGATITGLTAAFMVLTVRGRATSITKVLPFLPWVLSFSLLNSLSEELIFRFGILGAGGGLDPYLLCLISGAIFGVAHYRGMPNGPVGVAMAGLLGWLLARSVVETGGIGIAWAIHFVLDVVILGALVLVEVKSASEPLEEPVEG